jgi:hypothetical protein
VSRVEIAPGVFRDCQTRVEQIGRATLILGDCRDVLPTLPKVDAVVTDPPYGIGSWSSTGGNSLSAEEAAATNAWPEGELFDQLRAISKEQIFWGGNYFLDHLGNCRSPLLWDKRNRGMHYADGEFAWTSLRTGTLRIFEQPLQSTEVRQVGREHPTQKPIALMRWCIGFLPKALTILDPFLGSGTTGIAALREGRSFIGIERDRDYFEIACRRIREANGDDVMATVPPSAWLADLGTALLQIKNARGMTLLDMGEVLGRGDDMVAKYIAGEAEMGFVAYRRALEEWPELAERLNETAADRAARAKQRPLDLELPVRRNAA